MHASKARAAVTRENMIRKNGKYNTAPGGFVLINIDIFWRDTFLAYCFSLILLFHPPFFSFFSSSYPVLYFLLISCFFPHILLTIIPFFIWSSFTSFLSALTILYGVPVKTFLSIRLHMSSIENDKSISEKLKSLRNLWTYVESLQFWTKTRTKLN